MGLIVGLSGVDGSGKTTAASLVMERLRSQGYKVAYHHEIDFIFLKKAFALFSRLVGRGRAEDIKEKALANMERGRPVYSHAYYYAIWLDTILAYILFKMRGGITICDRWIYDLISVFDHKNYRDRLTEKLFLGFPRPDVVVLLTVPPEVSLERKRDDVSHRDHDLDYYRTMDARLRALGAKLRCLDVIESTCPPEEVATAILRAISPFLPGRNNPTPEIV